MCYHNEGRNPTKLIKVVAIPNSFLKIIWPMAATQYICCATSFMGQYGHKRASAVANSRLAPWFHYTKRKFDTWTENPTKILKSKSSKVWANIHVEYRFLLPSHLENVRANHLRWVGKIYFILQHLCNFVLCQCKMDVGHVVEIVYSLRWLIRSGH